VNGHQHSWRREGILTLAESVAQGLSCTRPLRLACDGCGLLSVVLCRSSRSVNCPSCAADYRRRVTRVAGSGVVVSTSGLFVTLTAPGARAHSYGSGELCPCTPPGGVDLAAWNASAGDRWHRFVGDLRRLLGTDVASLDSRKRAYTRRRPANLQYFKAAEVQTRGALHFHALIRRPGDGRKLFVSKGKLRALAIRHGFGHAVDVQALQTGHARYVAKYVSKACDDRKLVPWRRERRATPADGRAVTVHRPTFRAWSASRAWGCTMGSVERDQHHFARVLAALEYARDWSDPRMASRVPDAPTRAG
jgi:hypothetical protein